MPTKVPIHWPEGKVPTPEEKALAEKIAGEIGAIDWDEFNRQVGAQALPRPPGLRTKKSYCCGASVVTTNGGLRREICSKCGKSHSEPRFR